MSNLTATVAPSLADDRPGHLSWIHAIVFASGFAGLGYEIVWTRMLAVSLGHEILAVLAVLAAFFSGLAMGALVFSKRIRFSNKPSHWYAWCEIIIGLWALSLIILRPFFNESLPQWIGEDPTPFKHWGIAFTATFFLLLPATMAMGATLPALERVYGQLFGAGRHVAGVYSANTFGAVAGTILMTFLLAPWLGYSKSLVLCAVINFCSAGGMLWLLRQKSVAAEDSTVTKTAGTLTKQRLLTYLFFTGFLGLAYEVLVIRVLSQVLEDTVYTFAVILSIYLLGTAFGAAIYHRVSRNKEFEALLSALIISVATATLIGVWVLWASDVSYSWLSHLSTSSLTGGVTAEVVLSLLVFLLPAMMMGALFSHLAQAAIEVTGFGVALAVNTFAASLAPMVAGVLLLPAVGAKSALILVSLAYLLLLILRPVTGRWQNLRATVIPVALACALLLIPPLQFVRVPQGGKVLEYKEGIMAAVSVVADDVGTRYLKVNNHFSMGSTSSGFADFRQTHLPLLMHKNPKTALFLGVGTGMSLSAARLHPDLDVTAVELVPEVIDVMRYFGTDPEQSKWLRTPRILASDARRFVVSSERQFDVIIADLFHPSRDGAGSLYTKEHFAAIRQRLTADGLFCQWLPLFQMDLETFKLIARTFLSEFQHVQLHIPHFSLQQPIVGLVGSNRPLRFQQDWLQNRVEFRPLQQELANLGFDSNLSFFAGYIADESRLASYVGDGALNTDNQPLVTYRTPAFAYQQLEGHGERLVELVDALKGDNSHLLSLKPTVASQDFGRRIQAYWRARDAYLKAGLGVTVQDDFATVVAKIKDPLLEVVKMSEDFSSAYTPLLAMAEAMNETNPRAARSLLLELKDAAPSRHEAEQMLELLFKQ